MKILGTWTGISETSLANRIQEMEDKISDTEDTIEEMDTSVKKMLIAKISRELQDNQKILDATKILIYK